MLGGQPRLTEKPKKSRAQHGQEGEYSHDKCAQIFLLPCHPLWDAAASVAMTDPAPDIVTDALDASVSPMH
jgi:hypothetical protein